MQLSLMLLGRSSVNRGCSGTCLISLLHGVAYEGVDGLCAMQR